MATKHLIGFLTKGFILQLLVWEVIGYKIAITTPQIGSHFMGKLIIGKALVEKNHQVYLVVSDKYPKIDTIQKAGIESLTYQAPADAPLMDSEETTKLLADIVFSGADPRNFDRIVSEIMHKDCEYLLNDTIAIEKIKHHNFDLFIVEPFAVNPCNSILPIYVGKPFISLTLLYAYLELRIPALPSFFTLMDAPVILDTVHDYTMSRKLYSVFWNVLGSNLELMLPGHRTELLEKYTPEYKSWGEVMRKSELFLCEADHHLAGFVPAMPNYISVAGMTAGPPKALPVKLEKIMNDSVEHGVIILTFGASAYYMPEETVKKFLEAFSKINQTVLARFNVPDGITVPKNVKNVQWMPQNDLLGHPNTKLFITHCGNSGQYEALYHAVPMLGFPMFAEQHANRFRIIDRGFGSALNIYDFSVEELVRTITELIYNKKYKDTITRASQIWKDELNHENPLEKACFWIEHVIKYGGRHLRSPAMELSIFEFLMLDVLLFLVFVGIIITAIVYLTVRWIIMKRRPGILNKLKRN